MNFNELKLKRPDYNKLNDNQFENVISFKSEFSGKK